MKAVDIIKVACDFTGNEEIGTKLELSQSLTEAENKTVDRLLRCLNLVQNEVACEYLPLVMVEEVKTVDFKVEYSKLSQKPISIVSVKDKFGRSLKFKTFSDYLLIFANCAKIKYFYLPEDINSLENEINEPLLPIRIYAYGVAREYLLEENLNSEADIWEKRFKDSLQVLTSCKKNVKLPCRRWI